MGIDLGWNEAVKKFVTNVGLITTNGPWGHNIMAAEWTRQVSYDPPLLQIHISKGTATYENIKKTKVFGVNIAASDQNLLSSVSGNNRGKDIYKIKVLKELGVKFFHAKKINVLMVKGAAAHMECRVEKITSVGDHVVVVGRIVKVGWSDKTPIIYHLGKYWKLGERIEKPPQTFLEKTTVLVQKHRRK